MKKLVTEAVSHLRWQMGSSDQPSPNRILSMIFGMLIIALLPACLSAIKPVDAEFSNKQLPFVRDGMTTVGEVTARMGDLASVYENGRVFIYELCEENEQLRSGNNCVGNHNYDLVLVFGSDGILQRHSLVEKN